MKLLTQELLGKFKKVWNQSQSSDPLVICKFFDPCSQWTRYATEYDPEYREFFGYVEWHFNERWPFSLDELEECRNRFGLGIERDRFFTPCHFSNLKK